MRGHRKLRGTRGRRCPGRSRGAGVDTTAGVHALQSESTRPAGVRGCIGSNDRRRASGVFFPCLARHADRSSAGFAGVICI